MFLSYYYSPAACFCQNSTSWICSKTHQIWQADQNCWNVFIKWRDNAQIQLYRVPYRLSKMLKLPWKLIETCNKNLHVCPIKTFHTLWPSTSDKLEVRKFYVGKKEILQKKYQYFFLKLQKSKTLGVSGLNICFKTDKTGELKVD